MRSNSRIVTLICILILVAFGRTALPDSWAPPSEFDAFSENRQYVAHITPWSKNQEKPLMDIFAVKGKERSKIWSTELSNSTRPMKAYVADNGDYVVTTDNYANIGYGDDVVAFYGRAGQIRKYSLEQILPDLKGGPDDLNKFKHSTSSRWWDEDSILFFDGGDQDLNFCIWVDWDNKWIAWHVKTGERFNPSSEQCTRWNDKARNLALQRIMAGEARNAEFKILGRLKHPEDRVKIEQLLKDPLFYHGSISSSSLRLGGWFRSEETIFSYRSYSQKRQDADRILAEWDQLIKDDEKSSDNDQYYFLGVVKMIITFPQAPRKNNGLIRVYLIPDHLDAAQWDASRPDQYLLIDLATNFPTDFSGGTIKDGKLDKAVNFRIDGITPGKYWIKVIWDKEEPHSNREEILAKPKAGDYVSVDSPRITVEAGKVVEHINVNCTELVKGMVRGSTQK